MIARTCSYVMCAFALLMAGCASHEPWRVPSADDPSDYVACNESNPSRGPLIESVDDHASLAYIEFTERGNLFNRGCLERVYDHIEEVIAESAASGAALLVYIHGWKHNADPDDSNVRGFKQILRGYAQGSQTPLAPAAREELPFQYKLQADQAPRERAVVGVYIGWRGAVFADWMPDLIENVSYWDRKSVAQEIGKGGVTEVLLSLGRLSRCGTRHLSAPCPQRDLENVYLTIGHSFGAAIVVSAMNEVIMQRLMDATPIPQAGSECITTRPLSDGVILLNPAIEANQLLQVKELISAHCFGSRQDVLMHVISSQGDIPTHRAFPLGQGIAGILTRNQVLRRKDPRERPPRLLNEGQLDTSTVGNYPGFWTGLLRHRNERWEYTTLTESREPKDMHGESISDHLWAPQNSPVQMIYTDRNFIEDHNAIFNYRVLAYTSTVVAESLSLARGLTHQVPDACHTQHMNGFDFDACFDHYLSVLKP